MGLFNFLYSHGALEWQRCLKQKIANFTIFNHLEQLTPRKWPQWYVDKGDNSRTKIVLAGRTIYVSWSHLTFSNVASLVWSNGRWLHRFIVSLLSVYHLRSIGRKLLMYTRRFIIGPLQWEFLRIRTGHLRHLTTWWNVHCNMRL